VGASRHYRVPLSFILLCLAYYNISFRVLTLELKLGLLWLSGWGSVSVLEIAVSILSDNI
jgi:hypothetical protein